MSKFLVSILIIIVLATAFIALFYDYPGKKIEVTIDDYEYIISSKQKIEKRWSNSLQILASSELPSDSKFEGCSYTLKQLIFSAKNRVLTVDLENLDVKVIPEAFKFIRIQNGVPYIEKSNGETSILSDTGNLIPAPNFN